jgi:amidase
MQRLDRISLFRNYGQLNGLPDKPRLTVQFGERFLLETMGTTGHVYERLETAGEDEPVMPGNPSTGPIGIKGVKKGDVIACQIHSIEPVGHTVAGTEGILADDFDQEDCYLIRLSEGNAEFPGGLVVPIHLMLGCISVVPESFPAPEAWMHGGNMDITAIGPGACVHLRTQRDEGWLAAGDVHALQGEGEINGAGLEMASDVVMSVEPSPYQSIIWPLVETADHLMVVGIDNSWTQATKKAFRDLTNLFAATKGVSFPEAYLVVSSCADVRNGAVWMMLDDIEQDNPVTVTVGLSKDLF